MKENKKELIKLISKIAVALAVFVFVLINFPGTGCTVCSVVFLISKYNS